MRNKVNIVLSFLRKAKKDYYDDQSTGSLEGSQQVIGKWNQDKDSKHMILLCIHLLTC